MVFRLILLTLPALALAKIDVKISGKYNEDAPDVNVHYYGKDNSIISDIERFSFHVTKYNLKNVVHAVVGKRPDDVFVRSPTPWGDLYSKYGWHQVHRILVPRSGKILKASLLPTVVVNQTFENNGNEPAIYNVGLHQSVTNRISSLWITAGELSVKQKIEYHININVANVSRVPSFRYASSWGQNTQQSQTVDVGASSNRNITLQPGEAVVARLEAKRGFVQVEMLYEAYLTGLTALNYAKPYHGRHFHAMPIDTFMSGVGISNYKRSREVIDIEFFSDSKVVVCDLHHGNILMVLN